MTAFSHCRVMTYVFVYGSLWTTTPMQLRTVFCLVLSPHSLTQHLAHKSSIDICQISEKLKQ